MKLPVVRGIRLLGIRLLVAVVTSTVLFIPLGAQEEAAAATVLRVPQDHPTIQAAIDAAVSGDTVLVSPGTYVERIDYRDKEITVESTDGPATTIIDGNQTAGVVRMVAGAGQTPVLRGFTIRNGFDTAQSMEAGSRGSYPSGHRGRPS